MTQSPVLGVWPIGGSRETLVAVGGGRNGSSKCDAGSSSDAGARSVKQRTERSKAEAENSGLDLSAAVAWFTGEGVDDGV